MLAALAAMPEAAAQSSPPAARQACPVEGERIHWIADYCMASLSTDDEIAASECIGRELQVAPRDDCEAKLRYKRALCALAIERKTRAGSVADCVRDQDFAGSTVRNRGVGR